MSSSYSVFIPRVFSNIREERIREIFDTKCIGKVSSVDLISKKNQKGDTTQYYNMAFVHFERLYDTDESLIFRREVDDPNTKAKLVYEDPWFWVVLPFEQKEKDTKSDTSTNNNVTFGMGPPLLPFWIMTPYGPVWQWGYPPHPNMTVPPPPPPPLQPQPKHNLQQDHFHANQNNKKMIPPQVLYGNRHTNQRLHPKKRIDVSLMRQNNDEKEDGEC